MDSNQDGTHQGTTWTVGISGGGCEIMRYAWPTVPVHFSIQHENDTVPASLNNPPVLRFGPHRPWQTLLQRHLVDVLMIERGGHFRPKSVSSREPWGK